MMTRAGLLLTLMCLGSAAPAQELPSVAELQAKVGESLPGYWSINELRVIATSDVGDAAQPRRVVRFEADAAPKAPLFAQASMEPPYVLVVPTVSTDTARTLYGVLDLSYRAGKWSGAANIENPVAELGLPLSLFSAPTLELGSPDAEQKLAALRDQSLKGSVAALEREMGAKRSDHTKAMAELDAANANELLQAQSGRAKQIAAAETQLAEELAALEAKYRTALAELTTGNEPLIAEAKAERERLLSAEKEAGASVLKSQRDAAATDLEKLTAEHARVRGALIAKQNQELAELETGLATERRSLERQVAAAQEVIALQKQLTAALTERELGAEPLFAAFEAARERKREFLSRIPKEWQGTVTCADTAGKGLYDDEYVIRMEIRGIRPEGFTAGYGNNDAVFMISDGGFAFPAKFRMTSDDSRGFWGFRAFDIEIHQDGQMLSTFEVSREVSGAPLKVTCKIRLSS